MRFPAFLVVVTGTLIPGSVTWAAPATYYVAQASSAAADSNAGSSASPWKTVSRAAATLKAGETVVVRSGSYDEVASPANAGTAGHPITFRADPSAKSRPRVRGFLVTRDHVTIEGFEITTEGFPAAGRQPGIRVTDATGVLLVDNQIHHIRDGDGIAFGNATFLTIRGNQVSYVGTSAFAGGGAAALTGIYRMPSSDVLIERNTLSFAGDYLNPYGARYVFRNNTIGPADPANHFHIDGIQPSGDTSDSLMEGNTSVDNISPDNHFFLNQNAPSTGWIIRGNVIHRSKGMFDWRNAGRHFLYNNTIHDTYRHYPAHGQIQLTNSTGNVARNNIWFRAVGPRDGPYTGAELERDLDADYDLSFESGRLGESHAVDADPLFENADAGDFRLRTGSPAIDAGGPLTTATNEGRRGAALAVGTAGAFQPGWAGASADWIAVGTAGNTAQIASIEYATNTLKLASPLSWKRGDPVYLFRNSSGTQVLYGRAPDIGALESQPATGK